MSELEPTDSGAAGFPPASESDGRGTPTEVVLHSQFGRDVARGRKGTMKTEEVARIADGRIFSMRRRREGGVLLDLLNDDVESIVERVVSRAFRSSCTGGEMKESWRLAAGR